MSTIALVLGASAGEPPRRLRPGEVRWEAEGTTLALVRDTDGAPRVRAHAGGEALLPVLDLDADRSRLGSLLAIRLGLRVREAELRGERVRLATIPELRLGELVLDELRVQVVHGEELVLGLGGLPDLAVAVLPTDGVVRLVPGEAADALLADIGAAEATDLELPGGRPTLEGALLAGLDLAADPATGRVVLAPASSPTWRDAAALRLEELEEEARTWRVPELPSEPVSVPEGDRGDLLGRLDWGELADLRWGAGDASGAVQAARHAAVAGADHCGPWLRLGVMQAAVDDPGAAASLERADALWEAWLRAGPEPRERARRGRPVAPGTFALPQPDTCAAARAWLPPDPRVRDAWGALALGLDLQRRGAWAASEGPLRRARTTGHEAELALARTLAALGRHEPVRALVAEVPTWTDDPHPLLSALLAADLAEATAPEGRPLAATLEAHPDWLAGALVLRARTGEGAPRALAEQERLRRPGDAGAACRVALVLGGTLEGPHPDCAAARALEADARAAPWDALPTMLIAPEVP